VTPESHLITTSSIFAEFHPVICCTVSRRVEGGEISEGGYIQGAGDDTENWAHGLTPPVFWANKQELISRDEGDLPDLIGILVKQAATSGADALGLRSVEPTSSLFIAQVRAISEKTVGSYACAIVLLPKVTEESTWQSSPTRLDVGLGPHKLGSRNLRTALPFMINFLQEVLGEVKSETQRQIIIACENGKDLSIGVGLAIACLFFDEHGKLLMGGKRQETIDKNFIRGRLGWFSTSMPDANPNRATIQSVNSFLMDRPK